MREGKRAAEGWDSDPQRTKVVVYPLLVPCKWELHVKLQGQVLTQQANMQELIGLLCNERLVNWCFCTGIILGSHLGPCRLIVMRGHRHILQQGQKMSGFSASQASDGYQQFSQEPTMVLGGSQDQRMKLFMKHQDQRSSSSRIANGADAAAN